MTAKAVDSGWVAAVGLFVGRLIPQRTLLGRTYSPQTSWLLKALGIVSLVTTVCCLIIPTISYSYAGITR